MPESWWPTLRETMPTYHMGVIPETLRNQTGVLRSANPDASFAAWGKHAQRVMGSQALCPLFGEESPVASVYEPEG